MKVITSMKILTLIVIMALATDLSSKPINHFQISKWFIINDSVMGGVSNSKVDIDDQFLTFSGNLSLANNGGFASTRALVKLGANFMAEKVVLNVVGDGRVYKLRFRTNQGFDGVSYSADFATQEGELTQIVFKQKDFKATFRGYVVRNAPDFQFSRIEQIGLMLADKNPGHFELKVHSISFR